MVLSITTLRLQPQLSNMHINFALPRESLVDRVIEKTNSVVIDLNVICTIVNFIAQNIIIVLKIGYSIDEYRKNLDWFTLATAIVSCMGTVACLIKYKNRPMHKGRWLNFFVAFALVGLTGLSIAVRIDPGLFVIALSSRLLSVTKANLQRKEKWFLSGGARRVPIAALRIEDGVIIVEVQVSAEHAHLVDSLYQGGARNVAFSVYSGRGVMTKLTMKEE